MKRKLEFLLQVAVDIEIEAESKEELDKLADEHRVALSDSVSLDGNIENGKLNVVEVDLSNYEDLEDFTAKSGLTKVWVNISGPPEATEDDLINGGREAIARAGHQVGWVSEQRYSPTGSASGALLECYVEVSNDLACSSEIDITYGGYNVYANCE